MGSGPGGFQGTLSDVLIPLSPFGKRDTFPKLLRCPRQFGRASVWGKGWDGSSRPLPTLVRFQDGSPGSQRHWTVALRCPRVANFGTAARRPFSANLADAHHNLEGLLDPPLSSCSPLPWARELPGTKSNPGRGHPKVEGPRSQLSQSGGAVLKVPLYEEKGEASWSPGSSYPTHPLPYIS